MIGGGSTKDIFALNLPLVHATTKSTYLRTRYSPYPSAGEVSKTLLIGGQSLSSAWNGGAPYTPTNVGKVNQINIEDGGCYGLFDPPLGIDSGYSMDPPQISSVLGRLGDQLIDAGYCDHVNIIAWGVGGTEIAKFEPGGVCFQRLLVACRRAAALGLTIDAVCQQQGEADNGFGTTQAAYAVSQMNEINGLIAAGFDLKWILAKSTTLENVSYEPVRAAIDSVINGGSIFAGPDIDTLTGPTNRLADGTHLSETGLNSASVLWKNAIIAAGV